MNRFTQVAILLVAAASLGGCATGSAKFACPNPTGVTCMNATDVYTATNNADHVTGVDPKLAKKLSEEGIPTGGVVAQPAAPIPEPVPVPPPAAMASVSTERPALVSPRCCDRPTAGLRVVGDTLAVAEPNAPSVASLADAQVQSRTAASRPRAPAASSPNAVSAIGPQGDVAAYREEAKIMRIFISPWEDQQGDLHMSGYIFSEIAPRQWAVAKHDDGGGDGMLALLAPPAPPASASMPSSGSTPAAAPSGTNQTPNPWQAGSQNTQRPRNDSGED